MRSRLARCEKRLQELAEEAARLDGLPADPGLYATGTTTQVRELTEQRARVARETDEIEVEWLELSENLQAQQASAND